MLQRFLGSKSVPATRPTRRENTRKLGAVNVCKDFHLETGSRRVLHNINFSVSMGDRLAVLGKNGSGKSTLIKVLSGLLTPTSGYIVRDLRTSWPIALGGGFEGALTGYDNIRFLAKVYNAPFKEVFDFVDDFTELGKELHMDVRFYSDGMRMRLAFALSLAINFECYLIDEVIMVGDRRFQKKCEYEIYERRKNCAMILAVHDLGIVRELCSSALVLVNGQGHVFTDLDTATDIYLTA